MSLTPETSGLPTPPVTPAEASAPSDAPPSLRPLRRLAADMACKRLPSDRLDAFLKPGLDLVAALREWFGTDIAHFTDPQSLIGALERDIAFLDDMLTRQLNAILHHRAFQRLESGWRGIAYLTQCAAHSEKVIIRVLNVSWSELASDFERAPDFDQSHLFEKIYSQEFGMPGGTPYGVLLCDYEVRHRPTTESPVDDVATLSGLASVAAAAFAPAILAASPRLLGLEHFRALDHVSTLSGLYRGAEYTRFNRLRSIDDARFLGLVLPRILMREPHTFDGVAGIGFRYREDRHGLRHDEMCWGSAIYAFGEVVIRAFEQHGWFADICGGRRDTLDHGIVEHLSAPSVETDSPGTVERFASELVIPTQIEQDLWELGLISLNVCKDTSRLVFYTSSSLQNVPDYRASAAAANARISAMLRYILCVSRFAHYVKVRVRDRIGSYETAEACERDLQTWLLSYCLGNDDASPEMKARYPLREASAEVRAVPGRPGAFACVLQLRPHFQLDQIFTTFKLVTDLALHVQRPVN